jgi:hypothetical protein
MSAVTLDSGVLTFAARELIYAVGGQEAWRLGVDDLRLIAEYTNEDGPGLDDYFYVFAAGRPCLLYEAPMCAGSCVVDEVGAALGADVHSGLANSTTFNSRVIWPPTIANRPFLAYTPHRRRQGIWNRLKDRMVPLVDSELTEEVRAYLFEGAG